MPGIDGTTAVSCRGIVKEFGQGEARVRVLHGIDIDIAPSEITFLVGPSGCGKTTLISIIAGILSAEAGEVTLFGRKISAMKGSSLIAFRGETIGFIFQQFNLLPALTAAENASVPLLVKRENGSTATKRAKSLLDRLGIGAHVNKFPSQLSGGQQQRIAIARALIHEPRLIICDEPTASLDAATGHTVMELLRDIALVPGRAVIIVTHDTRIFNFADRIVHMADGRIEKVEITNAVAAPFVPSKQQEHIA